MVYIMGVALSDTYPAKIALTGIYGIGRTLARRICARLQIHENATLPSLTPQQITALTAFLSAPANAPKLPPMPLALPTKGPLEGNSLTMKALAMKQEQAAVAAKSEGAKSSSSATTKRTDTLTTALGTMLKEREFVGLGDRLQNLKVESDLKRYIRDNIMHHRLINTYVGRRHAMGFPVRGQRTRSNARTARRLNKVERAR